MWQPLYEDRLRDWHDLRMQAASQDIDTALMYINNWWWQVPMINRSLSWQDFPNWPDPWNLLGQSGFCDLARSLGMLYTLVMLERSDIADLVLAETQDNNLVLINSAKYILNWSPGEIVNNLSPETTIKRTVDAHTLTKSLR
jgi:hypothetical protein